MISGSKTSSTTTGPTTVYLVIPPRDLTRVRPLVRLMVDQIVRGLTLDLPSEAPPPEDSALVRRLRRFTSRNRGAPQGQETQGPSHAR